jgi:hypothetical protein
MPSTSVLGEKKLARLMRFGFETVVPPSDLSKKIERLLAVDGEADQIIKR